MPTYTVHEPRNAGGDRLDRATDWVFVKDGFSWLTALCPPLGFAVSGLWVPALAYLAGAAALVAVLGALGVPQNVISIAFLAVNVYLGFEHSTLQRFMLDQSGATMLGSVTGETLAECERRFFENWLPDQPLIAASGHGRNGPADAAQSWRGAVHALFGKS